MGFLLFAARKMQLKREINQNSYEQIMVSNQLQAATKRVADFQEQMNNMKNMTSVFAQGLQSQALSAAYSKAATDSNLDDATKAAINNYLAGDMSAFNNLTNEQRQALSQVTSMGTQAGSTAASAFTNVTNSIFDAVNKVELAQLKAEESRLENKQTSLQTMAKLLEAEYQSYDEALNASVKDAAPKFGLA